MFSKFLISAAIMISANVMSADIHPNRLLVKMKSGAVLDSEPSLFNARQMIGSIYVVHTNSLNETKDYIASLGNVEYIENDYYAGKKQLPNQSALPKELMSIRSNSPFNDPSVHKIWSFRDESEYGVSVDKAYNNPLSVQKDEIIVAVVDTGVDYNHEDLKANMWVNVGEIPGNGIDDDNNGYIDDIHGIDTLERDSNGIPSGNPMDEHSHGTHVSGTIGAVQNNRTGIAGIASKVKIMAIRAVPSNGDETDVDVIESFVYAAKNGARLINCSFGKKHNEGGMIVSEAIKEIGEQFGTLVVAAAGNDYGTNIDLSFRYPASYGNENLLVVASSDSRGRLSSFSNIGAKNVDIAAPGSSIYSTVPGGRYSSMSGTSMATPTVVGVAAEILAHEPRMTGVELKEHLMKSAIKVPSFHSKMVSGARADLHKGLQTLSL